MGKRFAVGTALLVLGLGLLVSCSFNPSEEEWRFVGAWEDEGGERWVFHDDGSLDISNSPVTLDWEVDDPYLKVKSVFRVFYIEAAYSFISDVEVQLTIEDSSALAASYGTGAGAQYSMYKK